MATPDDQLLAPYLKRIKRHLDASPFRLPDGPRLESWEIDAFGKDADDESGESEDRVASLYRSAAALRLKIEDEVREVSIARESKIIDGKLATRIESTFVHARLIDAAFEDLMKGGLYAPDSEELEQLNRSRLRLIRLFSGLWLLHDEITRGRTVQ
jgi:hypothetical protein